MVWLTRFPLEVVEGIAPLLRDHHFARLYMSGDPRLQQLLRRLRSRKCRLLGKRVEDSQLVDEFVAGAATDVEMTFDFLNPRVLSLDLSKITRLHIGSDRFFYIYKPGVHLTTLTSLQYFKTSGEYLNIGTIVLPQSITDVNLCSIGSSSNPVPGLGNLPWLRRFKVKHISSSMVREFFETVQWQASLTSLGVDMGERANELRHYLPTNLKALRVACAKTTIDLGAFTDRQKGLTSLKIDGGTSTINCPLPPSLSSLNVACLYITRGKTPLDAFCHCPPSLTRFKCVTMEGPGHRGTDTPLDGIDEAFLYLLPRLTLDSIENLLHATYNPHWDGNFDAQMKQLCVDRGLYDDYFSHEVDAGRGQLDASRAALLLHSARTEEIALQHINSRKKQRPFMRDDDLWADDLYERYCVRMLELGVTNAINLPEEMKDTHVLSMDAIHQLMVMQVDPAEAVGSMRRVIGNNKLVCLETIEILRGDGLERALRTIHDHRRNLPRLECVTLPGGSTSLVNGKTKILFANDMNLYFEPHRRRFVYRVCPPPSYAYNRFMVVPPIKTICKVACFLFLCYAVLLPSLLLKHSALLTGDYILFASILLMRVATWLFDIR